MQKQQISSFFKEAGFDYLEMELNKFYPINGWEILTHSPEGNVWKNVTHIVRKESCVPVLVSFLDTQISVSPEHQFWCRVGGADAWVEAVDLVEETEGVYLLHENGGWVSATFSAGEKEIDILDMTVEGAESYYSDGVLSHNTMHGDPMTTPGGMAIPFHSSVRLRLGAGSQIENKQGEVIGINVWAKTIKNKVAPPFRKVEFRIIFGKGIEEHEEVFDVLRDHGPGVVNEHQVALEGTGAWKTMKVTNPKGDAIVEKKFYKSDFGEMWADPQYKPWIDGLLEKALIRTSVGASDIDIDPDSYEEMRALRDQMVGADIDPEG
jgi:hypothetical protein